MEKFVREADVSAAGIYAILIPPPLESPEPNPSTVNVEERRNDKGELEIVFWKTWVGSAGTREYQAYVQKVLEELRDRTIERCGGK
jgi:hypothetical protein